MKKIRFEEEILSPRVKTFLAIRYPHAQCEIKLPVPELGPRRSIRLDVVASDGKELVLVETKGACYPEKIGDAIGQLLVYEQLLLQSKYKERLLEGLNAKGVMVQAIAKPKLYCAFPDHADPSWWRKWDEPISTNIFRAICSERKIGLLLIRFKEGAASREWNQISKDNLDDLDVAEAIVP
jgi:hypothetical protein